MEKVCPEKGKTIAGGSIVVTASGKLVVHLFPQKTDEKWPA
jgi:antitoxin (DNA-binding transcriptional repressor) of toxin-antitoxin stability system